MKQVPIVRALAARRDEFQHILVHTGQHYDAVMSRIFLEQLGVGEPDYMLGVGSGSHAQQTARVIERLEPLLLELDPDLVLVPGDVNSTLAAALVASKLGIPIGHVEAGLRSFDRTMPEEINRVLTDQLSDLLFIHSPEARDHLIKEGRSDPDIHYVGNTMIDTLVAMREEIRAARSPTRHGVEPGGYMLVTLHRPALVDGPLLTETLRALNALTCHFDVLFPVHPRTRASIETQAIDAGLVRLLEPLGYVEFLSLLESARAVLTDSGGIQEETTFLGVPCFTLRDNTERPITCERGTNVLLGLDPARLGDVPALLREKDETANGQVPSLWDGRAAERIVEVLAGMDSFSTLITSEPRELGTRSTPPAVA